MQNITLTARILEIDTPKNVGDSIVLNFSIKETTSNVFDGNVKKFDTFFRCSVWGKKAVVYSDMIKSGDLVLISNSRIKFNKNKEDGKVYHTLMISDLEVIASSEIPGIDSVSPDNTPF